LKRLPSATGFFRKTNKNKFQVAAMKQRQEVGLDLPSPHAAFYQPVKGLRPKSSKTTRSVAQDTVKRKLEVVAKLERRDTNIFDKETGQLIKTDATIRGDATPINKPEASFSTEIAKKP
jgi:hypothetical protein